MTHPDASAAAIGYAPDESVPVTTLEELQAVLQGQVPAADAERWVDRRVRPGMLVEVIYSGVVAPAMPDGGTFLPLLRGPDMKLWYEIGAGETAVRIIPPAVYPGCLLQAGGMRWCVRKSNNVDSLRVMPVNLATKLRTLPIEEFFTRYPTASVEYYPPLGD